MRALSINTSFLAGLVVAPNIGCTKYPLRTAAGQPCPGLQSGAQGQCGREGFKGQYIFAGHGALVDSQIISRQA